MADVFDRIARQEWLEERKKGIGGSEVSAVLGVSPWSSPSEVWARKRGMIPETPDNLRFRIGRMFESPIAQIYAERENVSLVKPVEMLWDKEHHVFGTPDRIIKGKDKGLEVKTADPMMVHEWGEEGSDEIPIYYACQVAIYMSLTKFPEWDVAVLFGTSDFRVYRLKRDLDLERSILQRCKEFWEKYVVGGEEPPPDQSKSYESYIRKKYPKNILPLVQADDRQSVAIAKLIAVREQAKELEEQERGLTNFLKSEIGDTEGLKSEYGKIVWSKVKDREETDWKTIAEPYLADMPELMRKNIISRNTTIKEGYRRFNVYPAKGIVKSG